MFNNDLTYKLMEIDRYNADFDLMNLSEYLDLSAQYETFVKVFDKSFPLCFL